MTIYGLIVNRAGIGLNSLYPLMTGAMIVCIGQAITAKFAESYFAHELTAGTPFTLSGAKELLRLGILPISVPLGILIIGRFGSMLLINSWLLLGFGIVLVALDVRLMRGAADKFTYESESASKKGEMI